MADKRATVLIVEDDAVQRESMRRLLKDDFEILEADLGKRAVERCELHQIDCVLLDYRLPDCSGLDLLPRLVSFGVGVIMLTAKGNERVAVEAMQRGCDDYLVKFDLSYEKLVFVIRTAIERSARARMLAQRQLELEAFVSTVAHDLKAPVRGIAKLCPLLREDIESGKLDDAHRLSDMIERSANHLMQLLNALLQYTRLDHKREPLLPVSLQEVVADVVTTLSDAISESGAEIEVDDLPMVTGDHFLLLLLFQNLIDNGLKFSGQEKPRIQISFESQGRHVLLKIKDSGIGIVPSFIDAVFTPFRRAHTKTEYPGSGIGLATCKRIVERHGGKIWVESEPDVGTTFFFTLPAITAQ